MAGRRRSTGETRRYNVALACTKCGARNYKTTKLRTPGAPVLSLKKFCKACEEHTVHIESA